MRATRSARESSRWSAGARRSRVLARWRSQAAGDSKPGMTGAEERRPWRIGLRATIALPSWVRGPVERRALARLAASWRSVVMGWALLGCDYSREWREGAPASGRTRGGAQGRDGGYVRRQIVGNRRPAAEIVGN